MNESAKDKCENCTVRCKSIFANLTENTQLFDETRQLTKYQAGEEISFQHEDRIGFLCIEEGHVLIKHMVKDSMKTVQICGPGDLVGYGNWYLSNPRIAVAMDAVTACFLDKEKFVSLQERGLKEAKQVAREIEKNLCQEIFFKDEMIRSLESGAVRNRVAFTLLSLTRKFGKPSVFGSQLDLRIDRTTMAELSGTVPETLARSLTELEEEKVILRMGRSIHVVNLQRLTEISEK